MNNQSNTESGRERFRKRLHTIIFEADTPAGRAFDLILLVAILVSVTTVMLESVEELGQRYGYEFHVIEWVMTVLFTIEYALRLYCVRKPMSYARSFYGVVDIVSILPTYLSLFFSGAPLIKKLPYYASLSRTYRFSEKNTPRRRRNPAGRRCGRHQNTPGTHGNP